MIPAVKKWRLLNHNPGQPLNKIPSLPASKYPTGTMGAVPHVKVRRTTERTYDGTKDRPPLRRSSWGWRFFYFTCYITPCGGDYEWVDFAVRRCEIEPSEDDDSCRETRCLKHSFCPSFMMTVSETMCKHKCVHLRTNARTMSEEKREIGEKFAIVDVLQFVVLLGPRSII